MDHKVPFVFNWVPKREKVVTKKTGRYMVSPEFSTLYRNIMFHWRLVLFPQGTKKINYKDEKSATSAKSAIFLQLMETPGHRRYAKVRADVEFEVALDGSMKKKWVQKMKDVVFRFNSQPITETEEMVGFRGIDSFGSFFRKNPRSFFLINKYRMLIKCRIFIPFYEFTHFEICSFFENNDFLETPETETIGASGSSGRRGRHGNAAEKTGDTTEKSGGTYFPPVSAFDFNADVKKYVDKEPDVILRSKDNVCFNCHSSILEKNDIFFKILDPNRGFAESQSRCVEFDDADASTLNEFLFFLYQKQLSQKSKELVMNLLYLAEKYHVTDLKEICCHLMADGTNLETVFDYLRASILYDLPPVKAFCLDTIVANREELFTKSPYVDTLKNDPELNLLVSKLLADFVLNNTAAVCHF